MGYIRTLLMMIIFRFSKLGTAEIDKQHIGNLIGGDLEKRLAGLSGVIA